MWLKELYTGLLDPDLYSNISVREGAVNLFSSPLNKVVEWKTYKSESEEKNYYKLTSGELRCIERQNYNAGQNIWNKV